MTIEIKVPTLPESVEDATVAKWYKKVGETIARDENLVDLETDKVMLEVPAPRAGVIEKIEVTEGSTVKSGQLLATIRELDAAAAAAPAATSAPVQAAVAAPVVAPATATTAVAAPDLGPSARRFANENNVDASQVAGTGRGGRVTKDDLVSHLSGGGNRSEKRVPMSRLRQRVAERLLQAQHNAAILTSFNEINMKPVMDLRNQFKDQFEKTHGVKLGFMSFFTKAAVEALKRFPAVNASIDGDDIIYHNYFDIGIAIGSERGLVVPVLRNVELMSMADIEKQIRVYAEKAKSGKIAIEDLQGGTFSITNGGTYGSMMSTPIINPPQTAILGMHNIIERPVVERGEIVIRPMMYIALSYDHRLIDGREAVLFLVTIKELLENPARMLLEI